MIKEFQGDYRWLSNFATVQIEYQGITYPSVEHAFVAAKSLDTEWRLKCSNPNAHPAEIKELGKTVKLRSDWNDIDEDVMYELLDLKFNKEPFKTKLLETKNEYIQEGNWWSGKRWGFCLKTNEGENLLGEIIMKIRYEILLKEL